MSDIKDVKFISYDGVWPRMCIGTLVFEVIREDGSKEQYTLSKPLRSGGNCTQYGPVMGPWHWVLNVSDDQKPILDLLTDELKVKLLNQINEKTPYGCCGGCLS